MADKELKIPKNLNLDAVVVAWLSRKAGLLKSESFGGDERISDSSVANEILTKAMYDEMNEEDVAHLRKMIKRQVLKQR